MVTVTFQQFHLKTTRINEEAEKNIFGKQKNYKHMQKCHHKTTGQKLEQIFCG